MPTTRNNVHNYYVTCECGAKFSDTLEACQACGKANPDYLNPTLNAKDPDGPVEDTVIESALQPTLNGKDPS